jgi:iron complex transport system substrate-binding protein
MNRPLLPVLLTGLLVAALATGCGLDGPSGAAADDGDQGRSASVSLAGATPLADPRDWEGPSTALLADTAVDPVTVGEQRLPGR